MIHSELLKRGTWLLHRFVSATGLVALLATSASADTEIAWLDGGQGKLLRTQGGAVIELETGIARATGLAVDAECGLHYMSGATLFRKDLGTGTRTTVTTLPSVLTRDVAADDVTFISTQRSIEKITFVPVARSTTPFSTINAPRAVAIAPALGKVYWVDSGNYVGTAFSLNAIRRMNLNGSSVESLVSTTAARALAIDENSGVMFWAENTSPVAIKKALLNGSGVSTLASSGFTYVSHLSFGGGFLYALDVDGILKKIHPTTGATTTVRTGIQVGAGLAVLPDEDGDAAFDCNEECPSDPLKTVGGICGCGTPDVDSDGDTFLDCTEDCDSDPLKNVAGACGCGVADTDTDADGTFDCTDLCITDQFKTSPGVCGCNVPDTDVDSDGTLDCLDLCILDSGKTAPGVCGCGIPDVDGDSDGTLSCVDQCDSDPAKVSDGVCGCGIPDTDSDGDGSPDCVEQCDSDVGKIAPGACGCGTPDDDTDGDGTLDCVEECDSDAGKTLPGMCGCGISDADTDGDGSIDCVDQCDADAGKIVPGICGCGVNDVDTDGDGSLDCQEQCPADPLKTAPGQCGCGQFEVRDGATTRCSNDPPVASVVPDPPAATPQSGCATAVTLPPFANIGGKVSYNVVVMKGKRRVLSVTGVRRRATKLRLPRSGRYAVRYQAVLTKGRQVVRRTKFSDSTAVELSSDQCRRR
ncbi:MAG: hypothetical protein IT290_06165 [Deltaproteobacteria bacterium]|nr:hypothetical protein [Deltaproteobacteria bacterium]